MLVLSLGRRGQACKSFKKTIDSTICDIICDKILVIY